MVDGNFYANSKIYYGLVVGNYHAKLEIRFGRWMNESVLLSSAGNCDIEMGNELSVCRAQIHFSSHFLSHFSLRNPHGNSRPYYDRGLAVGH